MKTFLSILLSLSVLTPIKMDRYRNSTNNTGNSNYNNFVQCTYLYSVDSPSNEIDVSFAGWVGTTYEMPQVYKFTLKINFREPVHSATLLLTFTTPDTYSYNYNYIAENCFVTGSYGNITVTAYNTDFCMIEFYFSGHMLIEMYDYPLSATTTWSTDPTENIWVQNGYNYFDLKGVRLDTVSLEPTQNYNTELNSIMNSVDGIEGLLTSIRNNTTYISNIDTNFTALLNVVNAINNKLDTLDNIKWNIINSSFIGTTNDFETYDTTGYRALSANTNIVFGRNNIDSSNDYGIFKLYIPIGSNNLTVEDIHVYQLNDSNVKRDIRMSMKFFTINRYSMTLYFYTSQEYNEYLGGNYRWCVTIDKWDYLYDPTTIKLSYLLPTDENFWTLYNTINQFNQLKSINNSLSQIITILGTTDINATDEQNKQTVDNKFNELLQNLTLPQVPERPSKVPFMKSLFEIFGDVINTPALDMAKWFIGIEAIVMLMGVILK